MERGSCRVAQAGPELAVIPLPLPPQCWGVRCVPLRALGFRHFPPFPLPAGLPSPWPGRPASWPGRSASPARSSRCGAWGRRGGRVRGSLATGPGPAQSRAEGTPLRGTHAPSPGHAMHPARSPELTSEPWRSRQREETTGSLVSRGLGAAHPSRSSAVAPGGPSL